MLKRLVAMLCMGLMSAGCVSEELFAANYFVVKPDDTAKIASGELGALLVDLKLNKPCYEITLRYHNLDKRMIYRRTIQLTYTSDQMSSYSAGEIPIVVPLPPGHYEFDSGSCTWSTTSYIYTLKYDQLALWTEGFEIKGGEVLYPGTTTVEEVTHQWGIAITPLETLGGRTTRSLDRYNLYSIADNEAAVRKSLQQYNPSLADRLVKRLQAAVLDKEYIRTLIANAYAAETSEIPPDDATALARAEKARGRVKVQLLRYAMDQWKAHGREDAPKEPTLDFDRS